MPIKRQFVDKEDRAWSVDVVDIGNVEYIKIHSKARTPIYFDCETAAVLSADMAALVETPRQSTHTDKSLNNGGCKS